MKNNNIDVKKYSIPYCLLLSLFFLLINGKYVYAFDITGDYKGFYQYYDSKRDNIVGHFTISIQQNGNKIFGTIKEPRADFGPQKPYLYSDFTGIIEGSENSFTIDFIKTYRYKKSHTVHYRGNYKSFIGEVQGEWNIGSYKGNFKISNIASTPDFDIEQPNILIVKPDFISEEDSSKDQNKRGIKVVQLEPKEIVGFASDNVKVDSVSVNGEKAYINTPPLREQNIMRGNVVKFTSKINIVDGENFVKVEAMDINNNKKTLEFSIFSSEKDWAQEQLVQTKISSLYRKKYAVVIGINNYNVWPSLECAVNDAISVKKFLEEQNYQVISLINNEATRPNILKTLGYKLPQLTERDDSVLIYFAGHGHTESLRDGGKEGYIVPFEAGTTDCFLSAISMRQLKAITQRIKAKHIMFIMDSCYSGLGFTRSAGLSSNENDYIKKITSYRAVQMITAGGMNEQVIEDKGHGIFTKNLLLALKGAADFDKDGYITGSELGTYLRPIVTKESGNKQTPNYGRFEGEGEYIFKVRN